MAMLFEQDLEIRCIKTLIDDSIPEAVRSTLLGSLNKDHFHFQPTLAAFNRIDTLAKKRFEIIDASALVADPVIDEDLRDVLKQQLKKSKGCKSKKQVRSMLEVLERYRKIRAVYGIAKSSFEELEKPDIDIEHLLGEVTEAVARANSNLAEDQFFLHFGKNDTSEDVVEKILNRTKPSRIKTGFIEYDNRNGGFPEEGVVILSATTSGGKSVVAMNLQYNLYMLQNKSTVRVSLEMGDEQETQRLASHITGINFNKFKEARLTIAEKTQVREAFKKFRQHGIDNDIAFTTVSPTVGMTSESTFRMLKPFGYQVVFIDYIGLFEGVDQDAQWRILSATAADAKRFSRQGKKCLVVILAQLDDTSDKLRYSKGIKEHADTMWQWNYSRPEQRELRILPIYVSKDRDGEVFNFELAERFDIMTAENMPDVKLDYASEDEDEDDKPKKKKKKDKDKVKGKGKKKKTKKLSQEDDEDGAPKEYALT